MNPKKETVSITQKEIPSCFHCGDECLGLVVRYDEKPFCCEGCKMVYSILNQHDLVAFYHLNEEAGLSQKGSSRLEYGYLDDPDTIAKLIDFTDGKKTRIHFYLPQIHCSSCLWLLEQLHRINDGITHSRVDFLKKEVLIVFEEENISLRELVELLASIGYPPVIQLNDLDVIQKPRVDKSLYYKLGLAGFAFGNIMLLSFPEYLGLNPDADGQLAMFFGYLNILLILPVLLYSGRDYFISAWQGIKQRYLNIDVPVTLGILALFGRSVYEILSHTGAGYLDSLAGLIFFLLIGKWFQQTTYAKIAFDRDYKSYFPIAAARLHQGLESQITLDKLEKGDHLLIRHGELIPADGFLLSESAEIDYSFVSGESELVGKKEGELLFAGGRQMSGKIELVVTRKVSNSYLTQLWNDQSFQKSEQEGRTSALANKVASFFTWAILLIAAATLFYWIPRDIPTAINSFSAVLIVACPCAVALSIPFTFGNVVRIFAKQGIFLKNINVIESLASIKHIVFDKTGTITQSKSSRLVWHGQDLSDQEKQWIRSLVHHSTHPLSRQIDRYFAAFTPMKIEGFEEIRGLGLKGYVEGRSVRIGSATFMGIDQSQKTQAKSQNVFIEIDDQMMGSFALKSQYRTGLTPLIQKLDRWAKISLLSGDNDKERDHLLGIFQDPDHLHFNKKPEEKLAFIKSLQARDHDIAMIGDGLNDAGALSQSDVGIVITENTSNFTPACDIVMDARMFDKLDEVFSFSRLSIRLVYTAYSIALLYNIIGLSFAVRGALSPVIAAILMPLSSVSIVIFGIAMSSFFAYRRKLME